MPVCLSFITAKETEEEGSSPAASLLTWMKQRLKGADREQNYPHVAQILQVLHFSKQCVAGHCGSLYGGLLVGYRRKKSVDLFCIVLAPHEDKTVSYAAGRMGCLPDCAAQWTPTWLGIYRLYIQHYFFCPGRKDDVSGIWHPESKCLLPFQREGMVLVLKSRIYPTSHHWDVSISHETSQLLMHQTIN